MLYNILDYVMAKASDGIRDVLQVILDHERRLKPTRVGSEDLFAGVATPDKAKHAPPAKQRKLNLAEERERLYGIREDLEVGALLHITLLAVTIVIPSSLWQHVALLMD